MKKITFAGLLFLLAAAAAFAAEDDGGPIFIKPGEPAPAFALKDQYDATRTLRSAGGRISAVVYADKDRTENARAAIADLNARYNSRKDKKGNPIIVLGIVHAAYLADVPPLLQTTVKKYFKPEDSKKKSPSVLLDWAGEIAAGYGYAEQTVNVYAVDEDGEIIFAGSLEKKKDNEALFTALDRAAEDAE